MSGKIQSNTIEAQGAISELTGLTGIMNFKTVDFGDSNVRCLTGNK